VRTHPPGWPRYAWAIIIDDDGDRRIVDNKGRRDRDATLQEGLETAKRAVQLDAHDSFARAILGRLWMMSREFDRAIEETRAAIELNPYSPQAHYGLGFALVVAGRAEEALPPLLKAVDLSPRDPNLASYGTVLATAQLLLRQPVEAARWARIATRQRSSHFIAHMHLAVALAELDDMEGAHNARKTLSALKPDFSSDYVERCWPFKRRVDQIWLTKRSQKLGL
jgi:Flp pilus assembly protein TadD